MWYNRNMLQSVILFSRWRNAHFVVKSGGRCGSGIENIFSYRNLDLWIGGGSPDLYHQSTDAGGGDARCP